MSTSFNFPLNPTLNQVVVLPDGNSAQWNGYAWVSVGDNVTYPLAVPKGGTGATNPFTAKRNLDIPIWTLDDAAPAAPVFGDRWIRPGSMTEVVWLPNSNPAGGGVWVNLADVGSVVYPIPVSKGGTGATTPAQARINLGILDYTTVPFTLSDGTVTAPGLAWASEPGLGWFRKSAGAIGMAESGLQTAEFGFPSTNSYIALYPRALGGSALYLSDAAVGAANAHSLAIAIDQSGHHIFESLSGTATAKGLDLAFNSVTVSRGQLLVGSNSTVGSIILNAAAANGKDILAQSNGSSRWYMRFGEGPPNDDFVLWSYGNDGTTLAERFRIDRGNGTAFFDALLTRGAGAICAGYLAGGASIMLGPQSAPPWRVVKDTSTVVRMYWNNDANHAWYYDISTGQYGFGTNGGSFVLHNDGDSAQKKTAGGWIAPSDVRIKERIEDYTPGLEAILALRPRVFSFRKETGYDPTERHVGMVAQEAMLALADTVKTRPGKLGDIDLEDMRTFDMTNITYALINAVKNLNKRLAAFEAL